MFSNEQMLLLVLFGALLHSWLGAMLRYVWRHRQTAPGFQYWAWSEGLLGMAYLGLCCTNQGLRLSGRMTA